MKPMNVMKRVMLLCFPMTLLFTGCTGAAAETDFAPRLDASYSVRAELTYGERDATASCLLTRYETGRWDAEFSEPAALSGVVLSFDESAVSANYKGLAFTVPKSAMPAKAMLLLATDVLDALDGMESAPYAKGDDGTWCLTGESEGGSYTMTFDESGVLAGFSIPSQPLEIVFSEYCVGNGMPSTETTSAETTTSASAATDASGTTATTTETAA